MSAGIPMPAELAALMAPPRISKPRCPKCAGELVVTITLYAEAPVVLEQGPGWTRALHGEGFADRRKDLIEQATDNYAGARLDEREEIRCRTCDFWIRPVDLEMGNA